MATAAETIRVQNFIDGSTSGDAEHGSEPVLNPATGEEIATAPLSGESDVDAAVQAAKRAFPGWSETPPGERALALLKIADALEEATEQLSQLESLNVGKPVDQMRNEEMPFLVDNLRFFAGAARTMQGQIAGEYMRGYTSMVRREALGVIGQVAPWNYPLMMAIWKVGPALAAGNTVVLKPSEWTPLTTMRLAEICAEHLPNGVLNVIFGHGRPAGASLVSHPDVAMVSLTGDVATGKEIAKSAADSLKRLHLELGGKAPVIVFDDADVEALVATLTETGYYNSGQDCTAPCRVLAGPGVFDGVVGRLTESVSAIKTGDPTDDQTAMGPVVSGDQLARVQGMVDRARDAGAEVTTGGAARGGDGFFSEPSGVVNP